MTTFSGNIEEVIRQGKKYSIIYADPPWAYHSGLSQGKAKNHYQTPEVKDLAKLQIWRLAKQDCSLFLWATNPCLPEAIELMDRWYFRYITVAFVWVKLNRSGVGTRMGLGTYTRSNTELVLLGTIGKPKRFMPDINQVIELPIGAHSIKPDLVRDRIVELMGDKPRIELFARYHADIPHAEGWDFWGNEI